MFFVNLRGCFPLQNIHFYELRNFKALNKKVEAFKALNEYPQL